MMRRLTERDPDYKMPEKDDRYESGNPFLDGYTPTARAHRNMYGQYQHPEGMADYEKPNFEDDHGFMVWRK